MASFDYSLARVKRDLNQALPPEAILEAATEADYRWRRRLLDPVFTVQLLVLQALFCNTSLAHLRLLAGRHHGRLLTCSALCQARARLPLKILQALLKRLCSAAGATGLFHGQRLWIVDGTSVSLPDLPPLQKIYPQPRTQRPGCGFPLMKVLGLFDAATGLLVEMIPASLHTHEQSQVSQLHPLLKAGDILLGDRGFCSYWHLALLFQRQVLGCFRIHQRQIVDFRRHRRTRRKAETGRPTSRWIRRLGKHDQLVEWIRPPTRPRWMSSALFNAMPAVLQVREVRYQLRRNGQRTRCVTIATTLLDPVAYPKSQIVWLYGVRWEVETHFRQLKTTMKMRILKCKTAAGVNKELLAFALAYNLVRLTMARAAAIRQVDIERISFADTLRWLLIAAFEDEPDELLLNPLRPDRHEPRAVKRRAKQYDLLNRPRSELRQRLKREKDAA